MIENLVDRLVDFVITDTATNEKMRDWYVYSLLHIVETMVSCVTVLMLGFVSGQIIPVFLFLIFFLLLRSKTGGFHCDSFRNCYFGTIICVIGVEAIEYMLRNNVVVIHSLFVFAFLTVGAIGALNHPNVNMDQKEFTDAKRMARIILFIETIVIAAFLGLKADRELTNYMMLAVILNAVLILIGINKHQEVKEYEQ